VESYEEKRRYERYEYSSPMLLYRMDYHDQYYYAEMKDYSKGGLSLFSNEKLVVDQLVYLEMKNYDEYATGPEKQKSYSGIVKWVNPYLSSNSDAKASYKYGIEYHEH
jgi:hypothetical protein